MSDVVSAHVHSDQAAALAAWDEWHTQCALSRCSPTARSYLHAFVVRRSATYLRRLGVESRVLGSPSATDLWHRFETHLVTDRTRALQTYKQWLFVRAEPLNGVARLDAIQGGAALILRDVLREWIRREGPMPSAVSLDDLVPGQDDLRFRDLIPGDDPRQFLETRDDDEAARRLAAEVFEAAPRHTRVALCLRALGLPLFGPLAERLAGCGHTKLAQSVRRLVTELADAALRRYPRDEAFAIASRAPAWARQFAIEWGRAEISMAPAFLVMEPGHKRRRVSRRTTT